jgi:hypothetical protein
VVPVLHVPIAVLVVASAEGGSADVCHPNIETCSTRRAGRASKGPAQAVLLQHSRVKAAGGPEQHAMWRLRLQHRGMLMAISCLFTKAF